MSARVLVALGAALAVTSAAAAVHAQEDRMPPLRGKHRDYSSPQHFAIELRFASLTPNVDSDPSLHGQTPYATTFPTKSLLLVSGEFDWQALRIPHVGSLGPGLGFGYGQKSGTAKFLDGTPSGETTTLEIYPFYAVAVFRLDMLWKDAGVPFVPYAKAGLAMSLWRASNTLGTSSYQGLAGKGYSLGTHLALGLAFNLNSLDMYTAKGFDETMGVNSTYFFGEYTRSDLDGLGFQADALRVGGEAWTFGLAFEF
jgi:hypothetical protein